MAPQHVPATRGDVEAVLLREAQERDELLERMRLTTDAALDGGEPVARVLLLREPVGEDVRVAMSPT